MSGSRRGFLGWLFLATSPAWLFPLAWSLAFSPNRLASEIGDILINVELLGVLGLLGAVLVLVCGPFMLLVQKTRGQVLRAIFLSGLFIPSFAVGLHWRFSVCETNLLCITERAQPLVNAISAYQAEHGHPPALLDDLAPNYLDRVPATGVGAWPEFQYSEGKSERTYGNEWALMARPPCLVMGFDSFSYFPRQNYADAGYRPLGNWGYFHD